MVDYNFVALPKIYRFLSGNELKVFVTMFDQWSQMKNEDGWYYRSQKQLCEDSNLPLRTLQRTIKKLLEKGVILTTYYNDGFKMATYNRANEYKINMGKVVEMSKKKDVKSVKEGCQNGAPYKNKEKKNKIYNNTSTCTRTCIPDEENKKYNKIDTHMEDTYSGKSNMDNIIQPDGVNNINSGELGNSDDAYAPSDGVSYSENEMSDGRTNGMNAMSEQGERQAKENESSGCRKETITSTSGNREDNPIAGDEDTPTACSGLSTAPTRNEINLMKQTLWQSKGKSYENFKPYEDRFIEMMIQYKEANPQDKDFIDAVRYWYRKSREYFPKDGIPNTEMDILRFHIESMRLADTADKLDNAIRRIDNWFGRLAMYSIQIEELTAKVNSIMENESQKNRTVWKEWADKLDQMGA